LLAAVSNAGDDLANVVLFNILHLQVAEVLAVAFLQDANGFLRRLRPVVLSHVLLDKLLNHGSELGCSQ